ncbi:TonB-dependent siderophore receptor [Oceanicella sp. SM1341]|uniref:TonB-dependent receptor plug domain-containing protein n=1 Tax=Oceanicella sp. SM1341 TaxID=1548889 RepID=UPI0018E59954|nr:TonB-dependent receptor [Oceanicella sp. SM1341]
MLHIRPRPQGRCLPLPALLPLAALVALPAAAQDEAGSEADPITLDPIVLTANRVPTPEREVGSAVTIIGAEELEERQVRVVSDVLRSVPGVSVNRTGTIGGLTQVRLRGSEGNQTLVIIDGIEVNDPASGSEFDFAHLLAQDIARIEVLRGPQSALYGSDAVGGVINIITRKGEGAPSVSGEIEGGTRASFSGHATLSGATEGFDYLASIGTLRTEGFSSAAEWLGNPERDGYRNTTSFAKLGFDPLSNLRIDLVGRWTDFRAESDDFIGGIGATDAPSASDGRQLFGRAQARLDLFEGRWQNTFGVSRTQHQLNYLADGAVTSRYEGNKTKLDWQSTLALRATALPEVSHRITFALEYEEDEATSESAWSSFDRSIGQTGMVGEYQLGLWDDLFLTASVRQDMNDLFGDATTWRTTAAYTFDATGTKLRASYGTGVKNPTLFELYGYTDTYQGNPDLDPETARGWDMGIDQAFWQDRGTLSVTYFNQRITDLIQGTGETSVNVAGTSAIEGVELGLALEPVDALTFRASYTWMNGEDATGAELVRRPRHSASLDVNYRFLSGKANVNLGLVWNGAQKDWAYDAAYTRSVVSLDSYTLVNLAAAYKVSEAAELFARVENLFDTEYEEVYTYGGAGRTAYAGLRVAF